MVQVKEGHSFHTQCEDESRHTPNNNITSTQRAEDIELTTTNSASVSRYLLQHAGTRALVQPKMLIYIYPPQITY